jgi:lipoyl(octanoyl) transferase
LTSEEKLLNECGIDIIDSSRGGDITFHGPGQLVCYPILNLNDFKKDVGSYVFNLEQTVINILKLYGIRSSRVPKHRGYLLKIKKSLPSALK